jgi:hypothetical protein
VQDVLLAAFKRELTRKPSEQLQPRLREQLAVAGADVIELAPSRRELKVRSESTRALAGVATAEGSSDIASCCQLKTASVYRTALCSCNC